MADNVYHDLSQLTAISHNEFGDQLGRVMPISRRINHQQSLLALLASSKHLYFMNPHLHAILSSFSMPFFFCILLSLFFTIKFFHVHLRVKVFIFKPHLMQVDGDSSPYCHSSLLRFHLHFLF